jgi:hypothetical protein
MKGNTALLNKVNRHKENTHSFFGQKTQLTVREKKRTHNKGFYATGAVGSCVSSVVISLDCCSGSTSNFGLSTNHRLLFLFSSSVSGAGRNAISQPSPIPDR